MSILSSLRELWKPTAKEEPQEGSVFHLEEKPPSWVHLAREPDREPEPVEMEASLEDRIANLREENNILQTLLVESNLTLRKLIMQQARIQAHERAGKGTNHAEHWNHERTL